VAQPYFRWRGVVGVGGTCTSASQAPKLEDTTLDFIIAYDLGEHGIETGEATIRYLIDSYPVANRLRG
jgi:hypothetical protein